MCCFVLNTSIKLRQKERIRGEKMGDEMDRERGSEKRGKNKK
jgi:hypothetical protein